MGYKLEPQSVACNSDLDHKMIIQRNKDLSKWKVRREQNAFVGNILESFYRAVEGVDIDGLGEYRYYIERRYWASASSLISNRLLSGECDSIYSTLARKCSKPVCPEKKTFPIFNVVKQEDHSRMVKVGSRVPILDIESFKLLKTPMNDAICGGKIVVERYIDILFERIRLCLDRMCIFGYPDMGVSGLTNNPGIMSFEIEDQIEHFRQWKKNVKVLCDEFKKSKINISQYGGITLFMDSITLNNVKTDLNCNPQPELEDMIPGTSLMEYTMKMMNIHQIVGVQSGVLEPNEMIGIINDPSYFHIPEGLRLTALPHDFRGYPTGNTHPFGVKLWTKTGIAIRKDFNHEVAICHGKPVDRANEERDEIR